MSEGIGNVPVCLAAKSGPCLWKGVGRDNQKDFISFLLFRQPEISGTAVKEGFDVVEAGVGFFVPSRSSRTKRGIGLRPPGIFKLPP